MKRSIPIFILATLLAFSFGFSNPNLPGPEKKIKGKWKLIDLTIDQELGEREMEMIDMMKQMLVGKVTMTFHKNGTYTSYSPPVMEESEDTEETGTWRINEDGTRLITTSSKTQEEQAVGLVSLGKKKMVIAIIDSPGPTMSMTFEKVKK